LRNGQSFLVLTRQAVVGTILRDWENGAVVMRFLRIQVPATFAAVLLASTQLACGKSVVGPNSQPAEQLPLEWSFERDSQPTLEGWRIANPSLTSLVREPAPGGGKWSLGLEADWAPTTGFIFRPILGISDGDVLRLTALVRAVDAEGGGSIALSVGPTHWGRSRTKWAFTASTSWTTLSVQDTISLEPGDTVWVALSSPNTEITQRQGRFDLVTLERMGSVTFTRE
jgi:hypothetical protein